MVNQEVLDRLQRARKKKAPKEAKAMKRNTPLPKAAKSPSKRSEKMKGVIAALKPLYDRFLSTRTVCEIKSPVCTGEATCVHHVQGRGIKIILDDARWKASCGPCNSYVENKDAEAREKANKVSKYAKNQ